MRTTMRKAETLLSNTDRCLENEQRTFPVDDRIRRNVPVERRKTGAAGLGQAQQIDIGYVLRSPHGADIEDSAIEQADLIRPELVGGRLAKPFQ